MVEVRQLETAIWSIADGRPSADDLALFEADERTTLAVLDRLIGDAEDDLASVRDLRGDERDQVVADFTETLKSLHRTAARLRPLAPSPILMEIDADDDISWEHVEPGEVQLQATWADGHVVVWAAGRATEPEPNDALADRLQAVGGPPHGWELHAGVPLPNGTKAEAISIPMRGALGWLVSVGAGDAPDGVGPSLLWLGRAAVEGVRLVARGSVVPTLKVAPRRDGHGTDAAVRWAPAFLNRSIIEELTAVMPGTVTALGGGGGAGHATTVAVLSGVVEAIMTEAAERVQLKAQPPSAKTVTDLGDSMLARLDGTPFPVDATLSRDMARRFDQWSRPVTDSAHPRLSVHLDPPGTGGVWLMSVHLKMAKGKLVPVDEALRGQEGSRAAMAEWTRLGRIFPALGRVGVRQRGQLALSQDEAWDFLTLVGPTLVATGFDVRAPLISRRKATPSLRLFAEESAGSVVGAHQLSNVAWSILFDDVELTAAEVQRLAKQARPLLQSRGKWIELDRVDLEQAAAALAERESTTQLTGAEILRHSMGLDSSGLAGGIVVQGQSWANDVLQRASEASAAPVVKPEGFAGELRSYQTEALSWIGFLDAAALGGCLALDMGLGKTPTVLAHLARTVGSGPTLVVAPAAVVGNWAAEAARFAPDLHVLVHHGIARSEAEEFTAQVAKADIVITTYATAVRDVELLAATDWRTMVLDEAQAIKNPASDTAQQLRRISAHTRLALTGTPIENGVADLWAILDFTNPGLVGPRPAFVAQMSGDGESALRALNGILLFRRTKTEPEVAAQLPDKIDELDHCTMTPEQIGLYQAVLDDLVLNVTNELGEKKEGAILAAITALKQICNHPAAYHDDGRPLAGRSGKLARLEEIVESVFEAGERVLIFTHFATWGRRLADHLTALTGKPVACYDGSLSRGVRDKLVADFQGLEGPGAMVLSLKAGGTGLNLTAANHVVLYDRWWNPAVEDQARDRAWRIGQSKTVISHRLVCPGTVDERVEEVVAGKRHIASLVLPKGSSMADLDTDQLRLAFGLRPDELLTDELLTGDPE
ncbi:MAG: DEAD/DEAH box helicase [Actinomycetota bacterium]|nr:DEAD/DEAH box helicase [Actinomycetota bacterium]